MQPGCHCPILAAFRLSVPSQDRDRDRDSFRVLTPPPPTTLVIGRPIWPASLLAPLPLPSPEGRGLGPRQAKAKQLLRSLLVQKYIIQLPHTHNLDFSLLSTSSSSFTALLSSSLSATRARPRGFYDFFSSLSAFVNLAWPLPLFTDISIDQRTYPPVPRFASVSLRSFRLSTAESATSPTVQQTRVTTSLQYHLSKLAAVHHHEPSPTSGHTHQ